MDGRMNSLLDDVSPRERERLEAAVGVVVLRGPTAAASSQPCLCHLYVSHILSCFLFTLRSGDFSHLPLIAGCVFLHRGLFIIF